MTLVLLSHLKEHRERRQLTQEELHKLSGISRSTIAELETGRRLARTRTAMKLAKALKTSPEKLSGACQVQEFKSFADKFTDFAVESGA